jgi:pilus assembly protein CpaF
MRPNHQVIGDVRKDLLARGRIADAGAVRSAVTSNGHVVDDQTIDRLTAGLVADLQGYGRLEDLIADVTVTDVVVNAADDVWVDRGFGMEPVAVRFTNDEEVRRLGQRLALSCGRRLDESCPFVDAPLAHGVRLHAILPPLVARVSMSIRIPRHRAWTLADLVSSGMVPEEAETSLRSVLVERRTLLITGGTATGKTTLLNAMLGELPGRERLVVVEDTRELAPRHPHVVSMQTRPPNIEGAGGVTLRDLVRQSLRMRPDRIVIGEVRGAEVVDLLTAFNTGHDGGLGTLHANGPAEVVARLEALAALSGLPREASRQLVAAALHVIVHLRRDVSGSRQLESLSKLVAHGSDVEVVPWCSFQ